MATTRTVSEPAPGCLVYTFTEFATGDTFDFGYVGGADYVEMHVTAIGSGTGTTFALTGSAGGSSFLPLVGVDSAAISVTAANTARTYLADGVKAIPNYLRLAATSGTAGEVGITVTIRRKVQV